jgi:MT0933-like antitoxin protein
VSLRVLLHGTDLFAARRSTPHGISVVWVPLTVLRRRVGECEYEAEPFDVYEPGYLPFMPDFDDIEQEAKEHSEQVDAGVDKAEHEADESVGGKDSGLIDKGGAELEKDI